MLWQAFCKKPARSRSTRCTVARSEGESDRIRAKARPLIYGYGAAAAGAGAVPFPIVGRRRSCGRHRDDAAGAGGPLRRGLDARTFAEFSSAVGGGTLAWWLLRYGLRELLKLIPIAGTVAAGAQCGGRLRGDRRDRGGRVRLAGHQRRGLTAPSAEVRRAFADGLAAGLRRTKNKRREPERHG